MSAQWLVAGLGCGGALGTGRCRDELEFTPTAAANAGTEMAPAFISLALGGSHGIALDVFGRVHAWGAGDILGRPERGLGCSSARPRPALVAGALRGERVVSIAAGGMHSVAVAVGGAVYAWDAPLGQLASTALESAVVADAKATKAVAADSPIEIHPAERANGRPFAAPTLVFQFAAPAARRAARGVACGALFSAVFDGCGDV